MREWQRDVEEILQRNSSLTQITITKNGEHLTLPARKVCPKCRLNQLASEYYLSIKTAKGSRYKTALGKKYIYLSSRCRSCASSSARKRNKLVRQEVLDYKYRYLSKHPCVDCGESNVLYLDFDHLKPESKLHALGNPSFYKKDLQLMKDEMSKCSVRCVRCHRLKTAKENNWYILKWIENQKC